LRDEGWRMKHCSEPEFVKGQPGRPWDVSPSEARGIQDWLAKEITIRDELGKGSPVLMALT